MGDRCHGTACRGSDPLVNVPSVPAAPCPRRAVTMPPAPELARPFTIHRQQRNHHRRKSARYEQARHNRANPSRSLRALRQKAQLRPRTYGPNSTCFPCGMKDEAAAKKMFARTVLDDNTERNSAVFDCQKNCYLVWTAAQACTGPSPGIFTTHRSPFRSSVSCHERSFCTRSTHCGTV